MHEDHSPTLPSQGQKEAAILHQQHYTAVLLGRSEDNLLARNKEYLPFKGAPAYRAQCAAHV